MTAIALLALGILVGSSAPLQLSLAVLAAMLLLRDHDRLLLAPVYGGCLLLVGELGQLSLELRDYERVGPGVIAGRLAAVAWIAGLGGAAAALAALAVTVAPGRSLGFTALGALAVVVLFAAIAMLARQVTGRDGADPEP